MKNCVCVYVCVYTKENTNKMFANVDSSEIGSSSWEGKGLLHRLEGDLILTR